MHPPRRNKIVHAFFSWYISYIIKKDFSSLTFNQVDFDKTKSILLLANHFSWWDGFVLFHINKCYFRKKFHIMISEENYRKVWFLKYMGSFSVKKNSRSIIETLDYSGKLLNDPTNLVLLFPQGQLYSGHVRDVHFQKGIVNLIKSSAGHFQCILAASFSDFFSTRKTGWYTYMKQLPGVAEKTFDEIKTEYNNHYEASRKTQEALRD